MLNLSTTHDARVEVVPGRYPYRPTCSCGEKFWGYVSPGAAQGLVDAHLVEVAKADLAAAPMGPCSTCGRSWADCCSRELLNCCSACQHRAAGR